MVFRGTRGVFITVVKTKSTPIDNKLEFVFTYWLSQKAYTQSNSFPANELVELVKNSMKNVGSKYFLFS